VTDFEKRLQQAIQRGQQQSDARARAEAERALSEQELRHLHTQYRLELADHVERCLRSVAEHLPGFAFETVVSDRGWGASISRDELPPRGPGRRGHSFSRLEIVVRPLSKYFVLEVTAKAAVRNREYFNRSHYQPLAAVEIQSYREMIDRWGLDYAELYAAKS